MVKSTKVAISLPEDILKTIEKERKARGESRSEFFRRAIDKYLKQEKESKDVEEYIHGYTTLPESTEEVEGIHQAGMKILAEESW
ncbi:MAG: ribbon-helix-helix protein, CopG family [Dehalococcoidales bacterium]|nr:MAG: ribbon-helix-helix protein, CopG family [Dehalococcoidales bacterium]